MKDFTVSFLTAVAGIAIGVYGIIWKSNCVAKTCLFVVPDWLPMF